jgi:RHS repeat-associated protein
MLSLEIDLSPKREFCPLKDGQNNVRKVVDTTGAVVASYDYTAFGEVLNSDQPAGWIFNHRAFGEVLDPNLGMTYLRARWMDPGTGRFNSRDPFYGLIADPQSLHRYTYADLDPPNNSDPSGLFTIKELLIVLTISSILNAIAVKDLNLNVREKFALAVTGGAITTAGLLTGVGLTTVLQQLGAGAFSTGIAGFISGLGVAKANIFIDEFFLRGGEPISAEEKQVRYALGGFFMLLGFQAATLLRGSAPTLEDFKLLGFTVTIVTWPQRQLANTLASKIAKVSADEQKYQEGLKRAIEEEDYLP